MSKGSRNDRKFERYCADHSMRLWVKLGTCSSMHYTYDPKTVNKKKM